MTMWMAPLPRVRSWERRTVLPSMATTSPWVSWATAWPVHSMKQCWNCSGSSRAKTSPKVSWEGNTVGQLQEGLEPLLFAVAEELDIHPVIGAADGATNGDGDDIQEFVPLGAVDPGVVQRREVIRLWVHLLPQPSLPLPHPNKIATILNNFETFIKTRLPYLTAEITESAEKLSLKCS